MDLQVAAQEVLGCEWIQGWVDGVEPAMLEVVLFLPARIDEGVAQDPEQPRLEVAAVKLMPSRESPSVGLLDEVPGVAVVAGEVPREIEQRIGVGKGRPCHRRALPPVLLQHAAVIT